MKRFLRLIVLLLPLMVCSQVRAEEIPNDEIWYTSTDGNVVTLNKKDVFGASIVSNTYTGGKGIIKFNGNVTSIGRNAFSSCSKLADITLPNSVTSIGDYAFYYCSSLASITIPNSVTSIGDYAFYYCSSLASITIPNSVTSIGWNAFDGCSSLASITIPNSVTSIGDGAFWGCSSLASITIPNSVTSIGNSAFTFCSNLTSITIPNSVTRIGDSAFYGCSSLSSVTIGDSVTIIGSDAFRDCSSLTSITIPNSVTSIGSEAFYNCSSLASITIPNSVTSIGSDAFSGSTNIKELIYAEGTKTAWQVGITSIERVTIPNSVKSIGHDAFSGCNLSFVVIPKSVESIGRNPFSGNENLAIIVVDAENTTFDCRDNCNAIIRKSDNTLISGCKNTVIPNSVTSIKEAAFYSCSNLTSITIPNSVTSIGSEAFYNCSSLASITIPNSVTSIGLWAFSGCSSLTAVHISSLESWCKIKFGLVSSNPTSYAHKLYLNNVELKDVVIPSTIDTINAYAFSGCSSLASITIPNSVTSIGKEAFSGCSSLPTITIPNSVKSIESYAFSGCSSLTSVTIPNSVTSIGSEAFYGCSSLTSVTIPNSVKSIGYRAFSGCYKLASITIPNSVKSIGDAAFYGCYKLASITNLATTPQTISSDCFSNYSATLHVYKGLKSVYQAADNWRNFTIVEDVPPTKATSITMDASTYFCKVYGNVSPSATVNPEATVKSFTWESSDPSILVVIDANTGQALGLKEGVATITAKTTDGSNLSASATVYVGTYNPVTSITLSQTSGTLEINKTLTLTATVLPENATAKSVKWTSSNTEIATVSAEGVVTALAPGTATITSTSMDGTNIKATCEITVPEFNVKYTDADGQEICRYLASGDDAAINDAFKRLEVLQPIENINITYTRSFDSKMVNNWQAWFMPFDVDYDDMSDAYEVAQIYGVLMDKAGVPYIAFQKMTDGVVLSNVPYAVRIKEAGEAVISTTTTLQQTANTDSFSVQSTANNFTFGGVYENSYLSAEYPTYALNKSGNFALMASDVYLRPFRFYMRITDREDNPYKTAITPAEVKVVVLGEDETSIENVDAAVAVDGEIYNLGGQKLNKLQKGINIVNGKKILF